MKHILGWLLLIFIAVGGISCGGAVGGQGRSSGAEFLITWPDRSRLIPLRAESVRVSLSGPSGFTATQLVTRPVAAASLTTPIRFNSLSPGAYTVTAEALPNPDGSGTLQASGTTTATVVALQTAQFSLVMSSTVTRVSISPRDEVILGLPKTVTATAFDALDRIVLVDPTQFSWTAQQNCTVDGLSLAAGATVTLASNSVGAGQVSVSYTEPASAVVSSWQFTTASQIGISLSPSSGTLRDGLDTRIDATVVNATDPSVSFSITGPATIQSSTASYAIIRPNSSNGAIAVTATSIQDPSRSTVAQFTAQGQITVQCTPSSGTISPATNLTINAIVGNAIDNSVTWTLTGATMVSSTSTTATVLSGATGSTYLLTATSVEDPTKSSTVTMTVASGTGGAGGSVQRPSDRRKGGQSGQGSVR